MQQTERGVEFTQSWLNTFQMCPHRAHQDVVLDVTSETDATAVGTATHEAIERFMLGASEKEARQAGHDKFLLLASQEWMQWNATQSKTTALKWVDNCFKSWLKYVWPQVGGIHPEYIERRMKMELAPGVWLSGATDLVADDASQVCIWDWKTGSQPYQAWEKERWAPQPRAYSALVKHYMGLDYYPKFYYAVMLRNTKEAKPAQILPIETHDGHIAWLLELARDAMTCEASGCWPRMDQGWWCSPKWCDHYAQCKGAYLEGTIPTEVGH